MKSLILIVMALFSAHSALANMDVLAPHHGGEVPAIPSIPSLPTIPGVPHPGAPGAPDPYTPIESGFKCKSRGQDGVVYIARGTTAEAALRDVHTYCEMITKKPCLDIGCKAF